jgi:hypothetical protein
MGLVSPHTDFDYARIVLDQLAHSLAPKTPQLGQVANAVMFLESGVLDGHGSAHLGEATLLRPAGLPGAESFESLNRTSGHFDSSLVELRRIRGRHPQPRGTDEHGR